MTLIGYGLLATRNDPKRHPTVRQVIGPAPLPLIKDIVTAANVFYRSMGPWTICEIHTYSEAKEEPNENDPVRPGD